MSEPVNNDGDFAPAAAAASFAALIALAETFTRIVQAETTALRSGERDGFEHLTARKAEYHAVLQDSMAILEADREKASAADRERWAKVAAEAEAALQENAKLIASEQLHAATMLETLRQTLRQRSSTAVGYGRDGKLKPRT